MNKAQLIELVAKRANSTKIQSETILSAAFELIQEIVCEGEDVKIVGFGTFSLIDMKPRKGRNPHTGELVPIPATKTPRFRPGKEFKEMATRTKNKSR